MEFSYLPLQLHLFYLGIIVAIICFFVVIRLVEQRRFASKELKSLQRLEQQNKAFVSTVELNKIILQTLDFELAAQRIANAIPQFLGYQTGVLAIVDNERHVLKRVAISETSGGRAALNALEIPFEHIEIDLDDNENYCIKALKENKLYKTQQLYDVLRPAISKPNSFQVQQMMGTQTTLVYPIYSLTQKPLGTFLVSMDKDQSNISDYEYGTISNFVDGVRIALVNAELFTSIKRTSERLKEANKKLEILDKLKNDFVSIASHELRTPMTAIKSYLWMALNKKKQELSLDLSRYLNRAYLSVDRLIMLVNDMLNVSRIEGGQIVLNLAEVDIVAIAREVLEEVAPKAYERQVTTVVDLIARVPKVYCDRDKVYEIILNLIGNALKFTDAGGKISLTFSIEGEYVATIVNDTGRGIAPEDLSKLFQKFGRLDNSYVAMAESSGTGLGLYITKSLVELHTGRVNGASGGLGKGATFTFTLPVAGSLAANHLAKISPKPQGNEKPLEKTAI